MGLGHSICVSVGLVASLVLAVVPPARAQALFENPYVKGIPS
jgi:hypothetical protein